MTCGPGHDMLRTVTRCGSPRHCTSCMPTSSSRTRSSGPSWWTCPGGPRSRTTDAELNTVGAPAQQHGILTGGSLELQEEWACASAQCC
eukprot:1159221-Pelagomonas_calceolata.AAC.4